MRQRAADMHWVFDDIKKSLLTVLECEDDMRGYFREFCL